MKAIDRHYKKVRDKKIVDLYLILTHSNLRGTIEDDVAVSLMYALLCIDRLNQGKRPISPIDYVQFAEDVIRVDAEQNDSAYSIRDIAQFILGLERTPDEIHKASGIDLKNELVKASLS